MSWTDERIEKLTKMWEGGATASQIADELGGVSRNAVIGKAHRLGLKARPSPVKPNDKPEAAPAPAAKPAKPAAEAPRAEAAPLQMRVEDPLVLSINRDGEIFLRDTPVEIEDLVDQVKAQTEARGDDSVFLKGDREVPYGRIVEVLDVLHRGGIVHVGMVTDQPKKARGRS